MGKNQDLNRNIKIGDVIHFHDGQRLYVTKGTVPELFKGKTVNKATVICIDLDTHEAALRASSLWNLNSCDSAGASNLTIWGGPVKVTTLAEALAEKSKKN